MKSNAPERRTSGSLKTRDVAMIVYHVTRAEYADAIDRDGFKDATDTFMTDSEHTGVWVSDIPMTPDVPWANPMTFQIDLPDAVLVGHEWIEEGANHREWLLPAAKVNLGKRRVE